jgi:condensin complex subunit 3
VSTIHQLLVVRENLGEEEEMVSITVIATQMIDWTDPRKNVGGGVQAGRGGIEEKVVDPNAHVDLAIDTLERVGSASCNKDEKKVLCTMLAKLYIPAEADAEKLRALYELVAQTIENKVAVDAPSRNALNKLEVSLGRIVGSLEAGEVTEDATGDDGEAAETDDVTEAAGPTDNEEDDEGDDTIVMQRPPRRVEGSEASEASEAPSVQGETDEDEEQGVGGGQDVEEEGSGDA